MFGTKQELLERQKQWRRYNAWQAAHPDNWPDLTIDEKWHWYCEVWETARLLNPESVRTGIDMDKVGRWQKTRAGLAALEVRDERPQKRPGGHNPPSC
ncbi:MAG: hypothetical protein M0Z41_22115 [Peptococcaceae bacterium]|jgi:hypothetical protein|nr:hypothetical protein [Peptococcaceae bacterium]